MGATVCEAVQQSIQHNAEQNQAEEAVVKFLKI